ncbi:Nucleoporin Nup43 [Smittium mucronatum]|uniref:Nucleoporin Nup43 n=1 Tax=Smittium mucronatum TaxID=133383 RepID=A0A1R0H541_9FUNG|nr:Nucleoporin Nup43 [Smittium mucronatum]
MSGIIEEELYSHSASGRISSLRWLPPQAGIAYNDTDLLFVTGTSGIVQELTLWSMKNPDFKSGPNELNLSEFGSLKHKGDVNSISPLGSDAIITSSSNGRVNLLKLEDLNEDIERILIHKSDVLSHFYDSGESSACLAVSVNNGYGSAPEIVSCGEDGFLSFISPNTFSLSERRVADYAPITDLKWQNQFQIILGTFFGNIKTFDKRSPNPSVQNFVFDASNDCNINAIDIHPTLNYLVSAVNENGVAKVFDLRNNKHDLLSMSSPSHLPYWDVQFIPQTPDKIAVCCENGSLTIFDYKHQPTNMGNHSEMDITGIYSHSLNQMPMTCVDFHPLTKSGTALCGSEGECIFIKNM